MSIRPTIRRFLRTAATYASIVVITLLLLDVTLMALGLFPPTYDYGDADIGWVAAPPTGSMQVERCTEYSTGVVFTYARNEDGIRTPVSAKALTSRRGNYVIGVTGDSQTELCAPDAQTHAGVLQTALNAGGLRATVVAYGAGRYSPVQDYIAYKTALKKYAPDAFVLNLYTGNDFNDILRVDDRPHLVRSDSGYVIAPPVWYRYDPPGMKRHSRVLFALRSIAKRVGIHGFVQRIQVLRGVAAEQGKGLGAILAYLNDLRKSDEPSVGYSGALSAQMLNQQLFFYRFPASRDESIRRVRALLALVRRENPGVTLMLSALPSYELVQQQPVDRALLHTLERLPITYEGGFREERALYDTLRVLAKEEGWLFADNLPALQAYRGTGRLYNDFDYHLLPAASEIIGRTQAQVLLRYLGSHAWLRSLARGR